jgi:hypothetical protein
MNGVVMHYELVSDRDVFLDAIGLLKTGETVKVTDENSKLFEMLHQASLSSVNLPDFVRVTIVEDEVSIPQKE